MSAEAPSDPLFLLDHCRGPVLVDYVSVRGLPSACVPLFGQAEKRTIAWFSQRENQGAPKPPLRKT